MFLEKTLKKSFTNIIYINTFILQEKKSYLEPLAITNKSEPTHTMISLLIKTFSIIPNMESGKRCTILNMLLTAIKAIPSLRFDNILLLWSEAVPAGASHCLEL